MSRPRPLTRKHQIDMSEINDKVNVIAKKYRPDKIILFGSYAQGDPKRDSDVDLLVIMDTNRATWDLAVEISSTLKHTFPMDILVRTPQEIVRRLKYGDFFIRDIMEKGKVLYEGARR